MEKSDCIFCKIVRGEIPGDRLIDDEKVLAFRDIDPKAPKHLLVIPKHHLEELEGITETETLGELLKATARVARKEGIAESGYRVVVNQGPEAGQDVPHLHLHVLGGRRLNWPPG